MSILLELPLTDLFPAYSYILWCMYNLAALLASFSKMQWVLSSKEINFPYPLGLTLLHMVFSSVLCLVLTKVFKVSSLLCIMLVSELLAINSFVQLLNVCYLFFLIGLEG